MLAVCLLTADRAGLTAATLVSFSRQNPAAARDFILLHADDGSQTGENRAQAQAHGFRTVYAGQRRVGPTGPLAALWGAALDAGAQFILHLENDIESVGPVPTRRDAQCVRMYGRLKMREGPRAPAGLNIMGTNEPIDWRPEGEGWERGVASWGGQPSITPARLLVDAIQAPGVTKLKDISMALQRLDTLRPVENLVWHIGDEPTPDHYIRARRRRG